MSEVVEARIEKERVPRPNGPANALIGCATKLRLSSDRGKVC